MCVIIDASVIGDLVKEPQCADLSPVIDWLTSPKEHGCTVIGGLQKTELAESTGWRKLLVQLWRSGKVHEPPPDDVERELRVVNEMGLCVSNDAHVIALARASGARTLCADDRALETDFRNPKLLRKPRGFVYKRARNHRHLLCHCAGCPRWRDV